ncbi:hypothetical protein EHP00_2110 [Ecytonucleospora hepatopenaei]|uniref:Uncharacterized protein n=1 Tax=Ecytonucleospora hepatopenaei TaxID=646526 RepID=A0A1W0E6V8_9MICR|nr:hypothetical protein EHP00_2110 [Ecytonucleospora hepatopenaei]
MLFAKFSICVLIFSACKLFSKFGLNDGSLFLRKECLYVKISFERCVIFLVNSSQFNVAELLTFLTCFNSKNFSVKFTIILFVYSLKQNIIKLKVLTFSIFINKKITFKNPQFIQIVLILNKNMFYPFFFINKWFKRITNRLF